MFLTRSIRRKMVLGLALVLVMLLTLSISGISGLLSFRRVVNELDFHINQSPHPAELVADVGLLMKPLVRPVRQDRFDEAVAFQQREFLRYLAQTGDHLTDFQRKLANQPPQLNVLAYHQRSTTMQILAGIRAELWGLWKEQELLADPALHEAQVNKILRRVAELQDTARKVPDPQIGLNQTLQDARKIYRSIFLMVCLTSTVVVLLLLGLIHFGYRWIFAPIRKLHQGASRVAQGDFDYRVQLSTNDEMAELAESFNKMTARFQEIADDLDRQVQERSRQLVRSERLAGVGFLAAGVAHEINNPLSAITMATESLLDRLESGGGQPAAPDLEVFPQYLGMIQREAMRCQQITAKLLDFSRGQDATRTRNDVSAIIHEVLTLVGHMSKFRDRNVKFRHQQPCWLEINGPEIKQVVLNLVANALESVEAGGTLEIELSEQTDHVEIVFRDNGCGMTPDVIDNLFEPFFTRKKTGKGTGLGLSISNRIINDHGGRIEATSDGPGRGSCFRVHLPRIAPAVEAAA